MTLPAHGPIEQAAWERMKCRTEHHLSDPAWLGGAHRIIDRVPSGRLRASINPWEDARFCDHYVWGVGES
jgi:hypothetical protein